MIYYWQQSSAIRDSIYIPKYYNPQLVAEANALSTTHDCVAISELIDAGLLTVSTGDEIGKAAYGTGDIPFVRTSDIANWEIKSAPKQGVSQGIYEEYAATQDVRVGDILFVRDGSYLIGNNCFITEIDKDILYQSHVLKLRLKDDDSMHPHLLFLALNNPFVQRQVRSFQFTADTIDTIGRRFFDLIIPIPRNKKIREKLTIETDKALTARMAGKAFVKHCPKMIEIALKTGSPSAITEFTKLEPEDAVHEISNETISAEFGDFTAFWHDSNNIKNGIFLPTYYNVKIPRELDSIKEYCDLYSVADLKKAGIIEYHTGDEIGKMAYGTGTIPFLRTSDFSNWEINHNPKQGVSEEIYEDYAAKQDVQEHDILLVRDGTYLVGSSCMITSEDQKSLFCGGLFKFRVLKSPLDPFLLLGLFNSYIVKRQIRTKQFTRDVIDTIGNRIDEVILPIPKSVQLRNAISENVRNAIETRIFARREISRLSAAIA
ncbi:hypothetical protein QYH69_17965 [Paraburkholderia sp. SARCC-3016]|uniref:hypothetical protein n=1 Tax=Paraburkholderia sp. SARCC-3016 TaxID=3058611 RepID=UPI002809F53B|nr:hypothetical protein [Paraburkholderia sp. SARCC-3016]MDQ7979139.1 hypothetical protein [Paraburkholderia sp. SARCC-3016]